jgi:3-phenylpropionate/trans-cinnamate dioxygenase ferredoxin reductase subunit
MARSHQVTINGQSFRAQRGELLLDAALNNGIDLPYNCRAGHCGTCCVQLVSGEVKGGEGSEPGVVHACQCRIVGDVEVEKLQQASIRTVGGLLVSLRPLSREVMEVGIRTERALPYHAGQYAQIRFAGYPSRPFSITHPIRGNQDSRSIWFHIRRMEEGYVTKSLGAHIEVGHPVKVTGPYGSAHFRAGMDNRLILVGTSTGFAPIWSIAAAALRENPQRKMLIIAGGKTIETLYMGPALGRLARFPNVRVVPCCSTPQTVTDMVKEGRPTDFLPRLHSSDMVYVCGAAPMVESVKSIAERFGAACYSDPFLPATDDTVEESVLSRAMGWIASPNAVLRERIALAAQEKRQLALPAPRTRRKNPIQDSRLSEPRARARRHYGSQKA